MWASLLLHLLYYVFAFSVFSDDDLLVNGPLSSDFQAFLSSHGEKFQYALEVVEKYGSTGSFGGKTDHTDKIRHHPILFIHGNSDSALDMGNGKYTTGWTRQIAYFLEKGYSPAELYALTYGDRDISKSFTRKITCKDVLGHKNFVQAILEYTKARKITIVGHSMGITIARLLVHGGTVELDGEDCDLGESILPKVDTLLSIASANYGMCICSGLSHIPSCSTKYGYFPGICNGAYSGNTSVTNQCLSAISPCSNFETPMSTLLMSLNKNPKDADHVFSMFSTGDDVLGLGNNSVWGQQTSIVPHSDKLFKFHGLDHFEIKMETIRHQYNIIRHKKLL